MLRNLLFHVSFGSSSNIFLFLQEDTFMVQSIFPPLAMAWKELQVCINGEKGTGLETQTD